MSGIQPKDKIYVAGHLGLMGSALCRSLQQQGFKNLITRSHAELDLENQAAVAQFFAAAKPDVVFLAAAKVGGIVANNTYRADFIYRNLQIQNHVIWQAHQHDVRRLIFLGSSCIYPKNAKQPMHESALLTGELEITNRPYAIAKIAGIELVESLRRQYQRDYFAVMPTNLYGPGDNFDPQQSHVIAALIRRFTEAKQQAAPSITIWGTGKPQREFLYVDDCADATVFLAKTLPSLNTQKPPAQAQGFSHINIGSGDEVSIAQLAAMIAELTNYQGKILYDPSKPDGVARKLLDSTYLHQLGWQRKIALRQGLQQTIDWYRHRH